MSDKASDILDELTGFLDRNRYCERCGAKIHGEKCEICASKEVQDCDPGDCTNH